jgi:rod shape-determining protein MreC
LFKQSKTSTFRFFILIVCSIILLVLSNKGSHIDQLRTSLSVVVAPIQYSVSWPISFFSRIATNIKSQELLRQENARLQANQIMLQAQMQKFTSLQKENNQLRVLLQSTPKVSGEVKAAELLSVDLAPFSQEIVLDIGRYQGVYEGQPVLDANGVVGQVVIAGPLTSNVLLITDIRSAIPVVIERTGMRAIAEGKGAEKNLSLINLPKTTDVRVGDTLITSGLDQQFPEGYPVGTVSSIKDRPDLDFDEIEVAPAAHINSSRLFLLVWPPPRKEALRQQLTLDTITSGTSN